MKNNEFFNQLHPVEITMCAEELLEKTKAGSGGKRDLDFVKYLISNGLLKHSAYAFKRTEISMDTDKLLKHYKKMPLESDRHFSCRAAIQEEMVKLGVECIVGADAGDMNILRENSCYDIITDDFTILMDIGLTPARNYFRGLTDLRVQYFMVTNFFDSYMDDIAFSVFSRSQDEDFIRMIQDYEESFKVQTTMPAMQPV